LASFWLVLLAWTGHAFQQVGEKVVYEAETIVTRIRGAGGRTEAVGSRKINR
jgi:hypothetical protein